jgi:hypothetical protein
MNLYQEFSENKCLLISRNDGHANGNSKKARHLYHQSFTLQQLPNISKGKAAPVLKLSTMP